MNFIIVAGSFNESGGKRSGWADKLRNSIIELDNNLIIDYYNGGTWEDLNKIYESLPESGIVLWLADVPNDKPKLVKQIKITKPKLFLITSKRNLDEKYTILDLASRALEVKANLVLEITGNRDKLQTSIIDPLCNVFLFKENNINIVAKTLIKRLTTLVNVKRISSIEIGKAIPIPNNTEVHQFFEIIKTQAEVFHNIIHGINTTRMLGNASFRCERGFPSFKEEGMIFVSQRNIDKRFIGPESFVAVQNGINSIEYYGSNKPSVDTPVQLGLFSYYNNIKFMLHSHTYIKDAPFTQKVLPCGDFEEAQQIIFIQKNKNITDFSVNILGHGSICLAQSVNYLKNINWIARPVPEIIKDYLV
jgi:hypothetical protein